MAPGSVSDDAGASDAATTEEEGDEDSGAAGDASKPKADAGKKRDASTQLDSSNAPDAPPPPFDASKPDTSVTSACNTVPVASVTPVAVSGFGATFTGGTLVDGVYELVEYKRYISGTSHTTFPPFSMGISIQGATLDLAGSGGRATYTFTASGHELKLTRTCPSASSATWDYTIAGDTLTLYGVPPSNGTWYATFKRL